MRLSDLLYSFYDTPIENHVDITGLALDSRKVLAGDLFFACKGTHDDGRKFIDDAIKKGAVAVVEDVDNEVTPMHLYQNVPIYPTCNLSHKVGGVAAIFYNHPSQKLKMVGITGTNGKTSCAFFVAQALQYLEKKTGIIGTLGNGLYGDIKPGSLTTPDAISLQSMLADFVRQKAKVVAMEVSSHSLDQGRINAIEFEVGIFTNLTRDHLDYHVTMEAYGAAKKKLFDSSLSHHAVINADDDFGREMISTLQRKNIYAYSLNKDIQLPNKSIPCIYADQIELSLSGITAKVFTPWGEGSLQTPLIGRFNLNNVLAVLTTLCLLKIPFQKALASLAHLSPVPGRMQTLGGGDKPLVVVDYAHTPDALEKVLIALRAHCEGKLYCVFGCGGDRDKGKRPIMAAIAEQHADQVMVTDDNPRTEASDQIVADIMAGFKDKTKIIVQHDRSKAIRDTIQYARARDCVLIAGKGAETYQQIGNEKIPFSDVEKVRESLL